MVMETPASSDLGRLLGPLLPYAEDEDKDKEAFAKFSPTIDSARAMVSKLFDASIVISTGVKDQQLKSTTTALQKLVPTIKRKLKAGSASRAILLDNIQAVGKLLSSGKALREEVSRKNAPSVDPLRNAVKDCVEAFKQLGLEHVYFPPDWIRRWLRLMLDHHITQFSKQQVLDLCFGSPTTDGPQALDDSAVLTDLLFTIQVYDLVRLETSDKMKVETQSTLICHFLHRLIGNAHTDVQHETLLMALVGDLLSTTTEQRFNACLQNKDNRYITAALEVLQTLNMAPSDELITPPQMLILRNVVEHTDSLGPLQKLFHREPLTKKAMQKATALLARCSLDEGAAIAATNLGLDLGKLSDALARAAGWCAKLLDLGKDEKVSVEVIPYNADGQDLAKEIVVLSENVHKLSKDMPTDPASRHHHLVIRAQDSLAEADSMLLKVLAACCLMMMNEAPPPSPSSPRVGYARLGSVCRRPRSARRSQNCRARAREVQGRLKVAGRV